MRAAPGRGHFSLKEEREAAAQRDLEKGDSRQKEQHMKNPRGQGSQQQCGCRGR